MNPGLPFAALAFGIWGLYPLYLRQLGGVPPLEVTLQRSVWSLLFLAVLLTALRRWGWLPQVLRQPRELLRFVCSALLLTVNWLVYVLAVMQGHVLEASLGYFINPLVSVLLGVLVLGERLRSVQWLAVGLAAAGVAWLTVHTGRLPWMALVLAGSFGVYGLLRKTATLGALEGLTLETLITAPLMLPALVWITATQGGALAQGNPSLVGWLLLSGPLTALPLICFAAAARRLPLATLGLVQYLSPTLQFLLGVWVFHEPMQPARLVGFVLIWSALALYSAEALLKAQRSTGLAAVR